MMNTSIYIYSISFDQKSTLDPISQYYRNINVNFFTHKSLAEWPAAAGCENT